MYRKLFNKKSSRLQLDNGKEANYWAKVSSFLHNLSVCLNFKQDT